MQHVRNCPIDCASIYYNGVRRSGIYTVVPSLGAMPVEVYCDMETDGNVWITESVLKCDLDFESQGFFLLRSRGVYRDIEIHGFISIYTFNHS